MDHLVKCAEIFSHMVDKDYILTLENGQILRIYFRRDQLKHLLGLHKLSDLQISFRSGRDIYKKLLSGKLSLSDLQKSCFYSKIEQRLLRFPLIEHIFEKKIIVDFDPSKIDKTSLSAQYILYYTVSDGHIHLAIDQDIHGQFPVSFFFDPTNYYLSGQTLLDIIKIEIIPSQSKGRHRPKPAIEEVQPDELDLQMIRQIQQDPDCQHFVSAQEAQKLFQQCR